MANEDGERLFGFLHSKQQSPPPCSIQLQALTEDHGSAQSVRSELNVSSAYVNVCLEASAVMQFDALSCLFYQLSKNAFC